MITSQERLAMAKFTIDPNNTGDYYIDIGTGGRHNATTWIVAKDKFFNRIIDQSLKDTVNLKEWTSPLPKLPEDKLDPNADEFYADLDTLYLRVIIHIDGFDSPPVEIGPINPLNQNVLITKDKEILEKTNSKDLGWIQ